MSDRTKKILLIVLFIVVALLIAFLIYYLFFRPLISPPGPEIPPTLPPVGLPEIPPALNIPIAQPPTGLVPEIPVEIPTVPVTPIVPGPVISNLASGGITSFNTLESNSTKSPNLSNNGKDLNYYDSLTGFFYNITPEGKKTLITDVAFKDVGNIVWASDSKKAILEYADGSNVIYDFDQKRSITLPAQWKDFVFSNDNKQIAFKDMRLDPENRYIAIADTNGTGYRKIEPIHKEDEDVHITWAPNDKYIALYSESIDGSRSDVLPIGFNGENFRSFTIEGRDFRFAWAPSGNKLLYSAYNSRSDYNPTLWVVNTSPELLATGRNKLGINTWADKCTFGSENIIYCAVPRSLDSGTGFLPNLADTTPDDFYKINLSTGTKELIAQPLYPTTASRIIVSKDNKTLYWLEKNTGQIKEMSL
jgi:Tol biopolymer transport system component